MVLLSFLASLEPNRKKGDLFVGGSGGAEEVRDKALLAEA